MGFKDVVDVSKLQKGTTAKNYKDMCNLLGCEPCKGNGNDREYQIKNWQRYFNFKKEGYKFIVTEVYDYGTCQFVRIICLRLPKEDCIRCLVWLMKIMTR